MAKHHYAIVSKRTRAGRLIEHAAEYFTRGEADKATLRLVAHHKPNNVSAVTVEHELHVGDALPT